ncbi:magnesium transporter CorA family protein [Tumebacillus lipolyticus]|uniref:Magnesium transporter CorA family protein n=1 Tax=Tumebacillus lipolyticus TaxID=1280370 RepID=A0ABW5A200_9BACL
MIQVFQTDKDGKLIKTEQMEKGCWIHLMNPTEEEKKRVVAELSIDLDFLHDALDEEERARIEKDEEQVMLFVELPYISKTEANEEMFSTVPLGILIKGDYLLTVCLKETPVLNDFFQGKIKNFFTHMRTRFVLQILFLTATYYLNYLKRIHRKTELVEHQLRVSMKNNELFSMLELEKSLVYFTTALQTNKLLMEKLSYGNYLKMYEEDKELLDEVMIETKQAIKMSEVYSSILSSMMNAFASVISNNVNHVVKLLTAITIVIAIPTMVASIYGMNVQLPIQENAHAFSIIMLMSVILSIATTLIFWKKKYF